MKQDLPIGPSTRLSITRGLPQWCEDPTLTASYRSLSPFIVLTTLLSACEASKGSILAPTDSVITLSASNPLVPVNGSTEIAISVKEADGAPVKDGTEVLITASTGQVDRQKVRTQGGTAQVMFKAPGEAGTSRIDAASAGARGFVEIAVTSGEVAHVAIKAQPESLPAGGGGVDLYARVTSAAGAPVAGAPVTFSATSGTVSPSTAIASDQSGIAKARLTTSSSATVTVKVHEAQSAQTKVTVREPVSVDLSVSPDEPTEDEAATFTIEVSNGAKAQGSVKISFGDGKSENLNVGKSSIEVTHVYKDPGGFNVTVVYSGPDSPDVKVTIRVTVKAKGTPPPPTPDPDPDPDPPDDPPDNGIPGDDINLSQVNWLHTDVSDWDVTSKITDITLDLPPLCIEHTKSGNWPVKGGTEGNPWVFAKIDGQWYAATYEWLKPGQTCKNIRADTLGPHTKKEPLESWVPRSGELVGFMVSTHARDSTRGPKQERSNVVLVRWP